MTKLNNAIRNTLQHCNMAAISSYSYHFRASHINTFNIKNPRLYFCITKPFIGGNIFLYLTENLMGRNRLFVFLALQPIVVLFSQPGSGL